MTRVLFATTTSPSGDADRGIFTLATDAAGATEPTNLFDVPGAFDSAPAWSPDGTKIAFESNADLAGDNPEHDEEIWIMDADGGNPVQLTRNAAHDEGPAWSPDGTLLAYAGGPDNDHGDIRVMTPTGVDLGRLTTYEGRDESPDWRPIPAPATTRRCGDRTQTETGARDVRAAGRGSSCRRALRLAGRWIASGRPARLQGWDAESTDFGGTSRVILSRADRHRPLAGGDESDGDRSRRRLVAFLDEGSEAPGTPPGRR